MSASVIVQHLVTFDGEKGHPMDVVATTVEVDAAGEPTTEALTRLVARIARDVTARARSRTPGSGERTGEACTCTPEREDPRCPLHSAESTHAEVA
jgi:hypothetical protein